MKFILINLEKAKKPFGLRYRSERVKLKKTILSKLNMLAAYGDAPKKIEAEPYFEGYFGYSTRQARPCFPKGTVISPEINQYHVVEQTIVFNPPSTYGMSTPPSLYQDYAGIILVSKFKDEPTEAQS